MWKKFNPCSPCCDICTRVIYPYGAGESWFYYGLNVRGDEPYYNPVTGETKRYSETPNNLGIDLYTVDIIQFMPDICRWGNFTMTDPLPFQQYLERGKSILITAEHAACYAGSGVLHNGKLFNLLNVHFDVVPADVYSGCQSQGQYAPVNSINRGVETFGIGGSSKLAAKANQVPILGVNETGLDGITPYCLCQEVGSNHGKVFMFADANMLSTCFTLETQQLIDNICKENGKPIRWGDDI